MPSTTLCSARSDEYTCETPHGSGLLPACHWNETAGDCISITTYCASFTSNETACNSDPLCDYVSNQCQRNSNNTAVLPAQGARTFDCIDCSTQNEAECNNQTFCYHNGSTCKRTPEAPTACSADDDDDDNNMPLILGLSIGLGVPFLLVVIYFTVIRKRGFTILDSATEGFLNG